MANYKVITDPSKLRYWLASKFGEAIVAHNPKRNNYYGAFLFCGAIHFPPGER